MPAAAEHQRNVCPDIIERGERTNGRLSANSRGQPKAVVNIVEKLLLKISPEMGEKTHKRKNESQLTMTVSCRSQRNSFSQRKLHFPGKKMVLSSAVSTPVRRNAGGNGADAAGTPLCVIVFPEGSLFRGG